MPSLVSSIRRSAERLALIGVVISGSVLSMAAVASAQTSEVRKVTPASAADPALEELPDALFKPVPETVADLRQIEQRVQSLVKTITECTVALRVGPAQGSGVIVSEDGYILTAAHVSGGPGRNIEITFPDGTRAQGRTLGHSGFFDASLVKIEESNHQWPHVKMADMADVQPGDWCLVTGHPGGYQPGRPPVVRLGRVVAITDRLIQTDCELVGGDSGGPVFDMRGQVIGINSRIGEETSLNLHVPVSIYSDNWQRLIASETFGERIRAFLGVSGETGDDGVRLTKIWENQPAESAGIQVGDVLLNFDGIPLKSMEHLQELVAGSQPGDNVQIRLRRGGVTRELTVRLGAIEN